MTARLSKSKCTLAMVRAGMGRRQLAMAAGVSEPTVTAALSGRRILVRTARKIARALKVELSAVVVAGGAVPKRERQKLSKPSPNVAPRGQAAEDEFYKDSSEDPR